MGFRKWARGYACHEAAISKVDPTLGRSVDIAGIEGSVLVEGFNMSETRSERGASAEDQRRHGIYLAGSAWPWDSNGYEREDYRAYRR